MITCDTHAGNGHLAWLLRGFYPTSNISSPGKHILINFSYFGTYGALSEQRFIKNIIVFITHHISDKCVNWLLLVDARTILASTVLHVHFFVYLWCIFYFCKKYFFIHNVQVKSIFWFIYLGSCKRKKRMKPSTAAPWVCHQALPRFHHVIIDCICLHLPCGHFGGCTFCRLFCKVNNLCSPLLRLWSYHFSNFVCIWELHFILLLLLSQRWFINLSPMHIMHVLLSNLQSHHCPRHPQGYFGNPRAKRNVSLPTKRKLRTLHEDSHQSRPGLRCMRRIRCTPPTGSSIAPLFLTFCELKKSAGINNNHKFEDAIFPSQQTIWWMKIQTATVGTTPFCEMLSTYFNITSNGVMCY